MAHLLRQPILPPGMGVFTSPLQRIAADTLASFSFRAPSTGFGLCRLSTTLMNHPGSASVRLVPGN